MLYKAWCAASLLSLGSAALAEKIYSPVEFQTAVDDCIKNTTIGEFDTLEAVLQRNSAGCPIAGVVRRPLPRQQGLGHIVQYDAEKQKLVWVVVPDPRATIMSGFMATPYTKKYGPLDRDQLAKPIKTELERVGKRLFWLLPMMAVDDASGSYEANNAMGASVRVRTHRGVRYSLATPWNWDRYASRVVAEVSLTPDRARELIDHLAIEVAFASMHPCDICLPAGTELKGTGFRGATFSSPYEIDLTHRYVFADVTEVRFVDTRNGNIISSAPPALGPKR